MSYRSARRGRPGKGHRSPKRFDDVEFIDSTEILKEHYSIGFRRPWWARLAHDRGWMSVTEYYAHDLTEEDQREAFMQAMYEPSAFFAIMPKDDTFTRGVA